MADDGDDDKVGYGNPPKHTRFKPGQSGNLKGRPKKPKKEPIDVGEILSEPITVRDGGVSRKMDPFEASSRSLVRRAINKKDLSAILAFLKRCEKYGLMKPPPAEIGGGVVEAPPDVDFTEWVESVTELVPVSEANDDDDDWD